MHIFLSHASIMNNNSVTLFSRMRDERLWAWLRLQQQSNTPQRCLFKAHRAEKLQQAD